MTEAPVEQRTISSVPDRVIGEAVGSEAGPTVVLIGGLHANEPSGIEASERVLRALNGAEPLRRGRVLALRGNLAALSVAAVEPWLRPRYLDADLNRVFAPGHAGAGVEAEQVAEISAWLERVAREAGGRRILIDLHTVSSDSPAFVGIEDSLANRRLAMGIGLPTVLGLEEELPGLLMDFASESFGFVTCILESGRHDDPRSVDVHEAAVRVALAREGMIESAGMVGDLPTESVLQRAANGRARHVYDVRERVEITDSSFRIEPAFGAFSRVRAGLSEVATERGKPITPGSDGLLFMPNRQQGARAGDDGFFVVRRIGRVWLAISSLLRSSEFVHRALPRLLPGVRRRNERELLVAPEIAAVLRRELLHLLGYRLIRWEHAPQRSVVRRVVGGAAAIGRAISSVIFGIAEGGERAVLTEERPSDWIVRRRGLDLLEARGESPSPRAR